MQAIGLRSNELADTQFLNRVTTGYDAFYRDESKRIRNMYQDAWTSGDRETLIEAREQWAEMNRSRMRYGFKPQPFSNLIRTPLEKRKYAIESRRDMNRMNQNLANVREP